MTQLRSNVLLSVVALGTSLLAGCGLPPQDDQIGSSFSAVLDENSLTPNSLNPNSLNPNSLNPNSLNPNSLNPNSLSPTALGFIQDPSFNGDSSRKLLKYTVGCALRPDQSFSFSWTDGGGGVHNETYWGILGLAPDWATSPLTATGQRWVSACLASRCNFYGVTVMLSTRGGTNGLDTVDQTESTGWANVEGAFWGNVFGSPGQLYACYKSANVAHSRAANRMCSSGVPDGQGGVNECNGIKVVGDCDTVCSGVSSSSGYYGNCTSAAGTSSQVVTVFLQ